jgi:hypothetical protein
MGTAVDVGRSRRGLTTFTQTTAPAAAMTATEASASRMLRHPLAGLATFIVLMDDLRDISIKRFSEPTTHVTRE